MLTHGGRYIIAPKHAPDLRITVASSGDDGRGGDQRPSRGCELELLEPSFTQQNAQVFVAVRRRRAGATRWAFVAECAPTLCVDAGSDATSALCLEPPAATADAAAAWQEFSLRPDTRSALGDDERDDGADGSSPPQVRDTTLCYCTVLVAGCDDGSVWDVRPGQRSGAPVASYCPDGGDHQLFRFVRVPGRDALPAAAAAADDADEVDAAATRAALAAADARATEAEAAAAALRGEVTALREALAAAEQRAAAAEARVAVLEEAASCAVDGNA